MTNMSNKFEADTGKILDIVINSLYSEREIFLRELVSNASDALDKRKYLGLTDKKINNSSDASEIKIVVNNKDVGNYIYEYNLSDFGMHQLPLYENDFGIKLLDKMPNVNWTSDKNNLIYRKFQDHMSVSIISSSREKQLLNQVLLSTKNLMNELKVNHAGSVDMSLAGKIAKSKLIF